MDIINNPDHYTGWWLEVIDILKAKLSKEEYSWYLQWNILKYIFRYKHKNWIEDLKKAQVYLNWLVKMLDVELTLIKMKDEKTQLIIWKPYHLKWASKWCWWILSKLLDDWTAVIHTPKTGKKIICKQSDMYLTEKQNRRLQKSS